MNRYCLLLSSALAFAPIVAFAAPVPKVENNDFIKLKEHTNVKLVDNLHSAERPNNNLKDLKPGKQKLGAVTYEIGDGILQLGSKLVLEKPEKFEGIKIGRTANKLHFLQGAGFSTADDTVVGKYAVHYTDKSTAKIEIVYGKDVVDWWAYPDKDAPTRSKIVWEGENEASKEFKAKIRLYHMEWTNPNPEKEIATIDFVTTDLEQPCAPFCVAITCESVKEIEKVEPKKSDK